MKLTLREGYEPGHIEMFYGQGLTVLGTLGLNSDPKEGDMYAELTVNGDWQFTLDGDDGIGPVRYWKPDQIDAKMEAAIKGTSDGDTITLDGEKWVIEWRNNNWFEVFVYRYEDGEWKQANEGDIWEGEVGPTAEEMETLLKEAIAELNPDKEEE